MEKRTITIVVDEQDLRDAMRYLSGGGLGRPTIAIEHLVAVDGDEGYDLNEFERVEVEGAEDRDALELSDVERDEAAAEGERLDKVWSEESFIADLEGRGVLSVVLPNGTRVLAKAPGVATHYANNSQAYKKAIELRAKGVNAFVIGQGKPAKYVRILPGNPGPEYAF